MKNLGILTVILSGLTFANSANADLKTLSCYSNKTTFFGGLSTNLMIEPVGGGYHYTMTQRRTGELQTEVYSSSGAIEREFYNGKPTLLFKNDHIGIFHLFGGERGFTDHTTGFSYTFKVGECEFFTNSMDGTYLMEIQIGQTLFKDTVILKGKDSEITLGYFAGDIEGSVSVANSFTAPLNGKAFCDRWGMSCSLSFEILAKENGNEFKVKYEGFLTNYFKVLNGVENPIFKGKAFLEDGSELGSYIATFKIR